MDPADPPVAAAEHVLLEPSTTSPPSSQRTPPSSAPIELSTIPSGDSAQVLRSQVSSSQTSEPSNPPQVPATDSLPPPVSPHNNAASLTRPIIENQQSAQQPHLVGSNVDNQSRLPLGQDHPDQSATLIDTPYPPLVRETTAPAIGPATDRPAPLPKGSDSNSPVLFLTLLLTTGARHPFKLDEKYLKKRNVEVEGNNPINLSLYKFKELILRDWREEWEPKPSSPESIRLISMGKLLGDKSKLADFGFKNGSNPHIIHMTIKPQEIVDEEDAKSSARDREGHERSPGCRCIIQ